MYPITDEVAELYKKHYRQVVEITFSGTEETLYLTEENIIQNGLVVDHYVVSGSKIEIGSAISAQLTLILNNYDESFNDVVFEGAELFVRIGVKKWDADRWENATVQYMPLGYFTVDETPRKTSQISLTALDRMAQTDKDVDLSGISFPCTALSLLEYTCNKCLIPLYTNNLADLPNIDYSIAEAPDTDGLTYRQIIQWIAELTGTCAYIDWNGYLRLTWYVDTDTEITSAERYSGADLYENDITITGVQITDLDDETYLSGEEGYIFNIEGNSLIQDSYQDIADNLGEVLTGTTYRPYSCTTVPMPWVYPMDYITYVDKKGVSHSTLVTHTTFTLNSSTTIKGVGETATSNGYASANPLTARERLILEKMKASTSKEIDELSAVDLARYNLLLELNQTVTNSLGLYVIEIENADGSITYWYADVDKSNIKNATVIYCFNAGGFAWVQGEGCYQDASAGNWSNGITSTGNAILNLLSVYKLTANQIETGTLSVSDITYSDGKTLADQLGLYVTSDSLTTTLTSYALVSDLNEYAKTSELSSYVTSDSLTTTLTSYATTSGGTSSSFAYSLTSTEFKLIANGSTVFSATEDGVTVTGTITATSGTIGGFTIGETALYNGKEYLIDDNEGVYLGTNGISLGAGAFRVTSAGKLTATDVDISGTISATGGTIGGFTIGSTYLNYNGKMYINASAGRINFWESTSTTNGTYANLDYQGLGSVYRISTGTNPRLEMDAYAQNGLVLRYYNSNGTLTTNLQTFLDSSNSYAPTITVTGSLYLISTSSIYLKASNTIAGGNIYPDADGGYTLGTGSRAWSNIYVDDINGSSDRKLKSDIETLSDAYTTLFDNIEPVRYKRNRDKTKRYHTGFIAQNVEEAIAIAGLTTDDFACYNYDEETDMRNLCYDEIIALCVNEIQKLKTRVKELENEIN